MPPVGCASSARRYGSSVQRSAGDSSQGRRRTVWPPVACRAKPRGALVPQSAGSRRCCRRTWRDRAGLPENRAGSSAASVELGDQFTGIVRHGQATVVEAGSASEVRCMDRTSRGVRRASGLLRAGVVSRPASRMRTRSGLAGRAGLAEQRAQLGCARSRPTQPRVAAISARRWPAIRPWASAVSAAVRTEHALAGARPTGAAPRGSCSITRATAVGARPVQGHHPPGRCYRDDRCRAGRGAEAGLAAGPWWRAARARSKPACARCRRAAARPGGRGCWR